ncbi:MAG: response regulator [Gemmiger sp.]
MRTNFKLEPVTAVFVDPSLAQRSNVRLYAAGQTQIDLCGIFGNGDELLTALEQGLRPQVIVMDHLLPGGSPFSLLRHIRLLENGYRPIILFTIPTLLDSGTCDLLLTSGVNSFILKPYTLPQLFEEVFLRAAEPASVTAYRVRAAYNECLTQLGASGRLNGTRYLEHMICEMVLNDHGQNLKELYHLAAVPENLSDFAVASGIKRLAERIHAVSTPAYQRMCAENGEPVDQPLSNGALVRCFTIQIRRAITD